MATRVKVRGRGRGLGAFPGGEANASARRGGLLGSTDTRGDCEARDWGEGMLGPGGAGARVVRWNWDAVGARRAVSREGRKVLRIGGRGSGHAARERREAVSDVGARGGIVPTDVDDRDAPAVGTGGVGAEQIVVAPEVPRQTGNVIRVRVGPQDTNGGDHPFIGKNP